MIGITPACAGKTRRNYTEMRTKKDHPRLRGKDKIGRMALKIEWGSPPLTQERLSKSTFWTTHFGITPADAGKTHICSA